MKFRGPLWNTLWLILIFIGLFLYLAFVERPAAEKKDAEEARSKQVLHFKVEDVEAFDLVKPSGTITIQRNPENARWNIIQPQAFKGEDGVINQLLLTLEEAEISRVVDEKPNNLEEFGLKDPALKVVLRFKTGEPKILLLGDASPIGHDTFIKLADEQRVLLSFLDTSLLKSAPNDLRNRTLLDFVARDVTLVDLRIEKQFQRFVKKGGDWKLTAPVNVRGDDDEISNFLNNIRAERIETFLPETPKDLGALGLDPPHIVLNLHAEKAKQSWTLKIGKAFDKDSYFAQRNQPDNVITVSKTLVQTLSKNPLSFMEKSLVTFKDEEITAIESRDGRKSVRVVRNSEHKEQWKFANPESGDVDSATVNTLLFDLQEAQIHSFSPVRDLKLFGLNDPRKELTVFKEDGSKITLQLGNNNKDKNYYFVARNTDQTIFDLDAETVKKVFRSPDDFKDKKLLKFDPEQVSRIRLIYPDKSFELSKRDNQWMLIQPEELEDIKPFVAKDILWTLSNLEYETRPNSRQIQKETGLGKPRLILSLHDRDQNILGQIKIGQPAKDQSLIYSQVTGDPTLYPIKDRILGEIPDSLDRFRKKPN